MLEIVFSNTVFSNTKPQTARKGEQEIDLIAVNEIDRIVEVYAIKKDSRRYNEALLQAKVEVMLKKCKELSGMQVTLGILSLEDM